MSAGLTIGDWFRYFVRNQPDAPYAVQGDHSVTWGEAGELVDRIAGRLAADGVRKGDRFAVLSKNSIDMALLYAAGACSGAVPVPLNYRLAPPEWASIVADAGCKVLLGQSSFTEPLGGGWQVFDDWLDGPVDTFDRPDATDVLYQMYTSGTTGMPKGALLTHANLEANMDQVAATWTHRLGAGDRMLACAPMYHASGGLAAIATARWGLTLEVHADFDPAAVVEALDNGVVNTTLVPVMIQLCLAVPGADERKYEALRTISYGAAPMPEPLMVRALDVFGCELVQGFGQTEATSCITMLTGRDHDLARAGRPELLASVGRPLPGTEVRIVDPSTGVELPAGEVGEIVVRGPQVMLGYWNAPEQTASTLRDGWLHTGDAGEVDAEGYVYIRDRIKDMIVSGGSNVYSVEVEQAVVTHPKVAEVAVIGVPDEQWGETVLAIVVPVPGESVTLEEIQEHCRQFIGGYKVPRRLQVLDALPRNPSGKVLKHLLRQPTG